MIAGKITNDPRKLVINTGRINPWESMISTRLTLILKHFMNIATNNPPNNPMTKHTAMFSMYPAPLPQIIAPDIDPIEISLMLGVPAFMKIDPMYTPAVLAIIENQTFAGPAFALKVDPVPEKYLLEPALPFFLGKIP